ncbi:MAG: hypothetical protein K2X49_07070 [Acetobacteraceae bacterium]|nr:hypothetical protein [Acetobacteraceae bacterium]
MLLRCGTKVMGGAAAAMGGMALLAAGPFLAGLGVGAALVGGTCMARQAMRRRSAWRDEDAAMSMPASGPAMPDEGDTPAFDAPG